MLSVSSADLFKINFFQKILSETLSECQTAAWIQIRTDSVGLHLGDPVPTVYKGFKQTTKVIISKKRVKSHYIYLGQDLRI